MMSMPKELKSRPKRDDEGEEEGSAKRSIIASVHINSQLETATNMSFFEQTCQAANNINHLDKHVPQARQQSTDARPLPYYRIS